MKKIHLLSLGGLFISNIVFAAPPVTLDDVNNQLDLVANGPEYSPPQTEREQLWNRFNAVPDESGSGNIETVKITGSECAQKYCYAYAQCPSNYKLTGGGWELTQYSGGTGFSAPNASYPDVDNNRWVLYRGGMDEWRGYRAYAVCMKK